MTPERVRQRVMSRWTPDGECWISSYSVGSHGYAQVGWSQGGANRVALAHRAAYEACYGEIPADMTVDHICHRRRCVRPTHLRLLTNEQNSSDNGQSRINPTTERFCGRGHRMAARPSGRNYCRECNNEWRRAARRLARERTA